MADDERPDESTGDEAAPPPPPGPPPSPFAPPPAGGTPPGAGAPATGGYAATPPTPPPPPPPPSGGPAATPPPPPPTGAPGAPPPPPPAAAGGFGAPPPPPPGQWGAPPGYVGGVQSGPKTEGLAIAGLVCGIASIPLAFCCGLGLVLGVLGVVFGFMSRKRIDESGGLKTGRGMATAGLICGAVGIGFFVLWLILVIAGNISTSTTS